MRISDWSSDVCSSDLRPDGIFDVVRQRVEIEGLEVNLAVKLPIDGLTVSAGYAHIDGRFDADQDGAVDTDLDGANISPDRLNLAAAPPVAPSPTINPARTLRRMWPAVIATKSRSARLNGRIMNEISSTGTMIGSLHAGTPCGTNREKECRPCRAKPTNRTVAKEINARPAVTVKWQETGKTREPG